MEKVLAELKATRESKGYSQEYVADWLRVSSSTISRWEQGVSGLPLAQALQYAQLLELDLGELFASDARPEVCAPIAELRIEVYTEKAYEQISALIGQLGIHQATQSTTRKQWRSSQSKAKPTKN